MSGSSAFCSSTTTATFSSPRASSGGSVSSAARTWSSNRLIVGLGDGQREQRLLGVEAVLGLVPGCALRAVQDILGDLVAEVRRQAMEDDRVRVGEREQLAVNPVVGEVPGAPLALVLLAHARPDVCAEHIRVARRLAWIAKRLDARRLVALGRGGDELHAER